MTSDAPAESAPLPPKRSLGAWARVRSTFAKVRAMDGASHVVAIVAAIAFALCFGWDYGVDNQVVYLLSSLRVMDSTLLPHDWFATQTTHYHVAFRFLGGLLLALSERGWAVAITAHVSIAAGALALYALARSLCAKHAALAAYLATLLLALITRTRGAGSSYVFDHILQPSTVASAGLLIGIALFARGRWFWSGAWVALGGLFHANILVLAYAACFFAHLGLGRRNLLARLVQQMLLPSLALLLLSPLIIETALSPHAAEAQAIWMNVRAPHHYGLARFEDHFTTFAAWHLIGFGAASWLARKREAAVKRTVAITGGLAAVIWISVALSVLFDIRQATQLFAWRISPHVTLLLQLLLAAGAVELAVSADAATKPRPAGVGIFVAGVGLLALVYGVRKEDELPLVVLALSVSALLVWLLARTRTWLPPRAASLTRRIWPMLGGGLAATLLAVPFASHASSAIQSAVRRSSVIKGIGSAETELYRFMREKTPKDALFLSPPDVETLRFRGRRSIVVDWKSVPIMPPEVLEWHKRLSAVAGRPIRSFGDVRGYNTMDARRLKQLADEYHFQYVIVRRGQERRLGPFPILFSNRKYVVLDVRALTAG